MAAAGAEVGHAQLREAGQALDLAPQLGLGLGVQNVQFEFAHAAEGSTRFKLVDDRKAVNLPHGGLGPKAVELQVELSLSDREPVAGQAKTVCQPVNKVRLENTAAAEEGIAGQPDQL